ncbi:MAG: TonB-dependent receptor [Agriterribacter sp.]
MIIQKGINILKFYVAILFACICTEVTAQHITVKVINDKTNLPVEKASVRIEGTKKGAITDSAGQVRLTGLQPGKYTLLSSCVGYLPAKKTIRITDSTESIITISLVGDSRQLDEVKVIGITQEQAEANKVRSNVMPVTILSAKQIENRASNLTELLARQTGVQIRRTGGVGSEARISVRGLEGKRVQIFIDGNPLNTPDGSLGINDLPLQIIERIEIYKGTIPAWLGGDGLGSAVNVVIRHRDMSYIDATASYQSYNTINTGLILKKTFDKAGIEAGAGIFINSSDNNYIMESPYQPGLKIKRDHDKFKSVLIGGAIRFHRLWFDEVEIEAGYLDIWKQLQGIQQNIQHIESEGKSLFTVLGLKKKNLLDNKLSLNYHAVGGFINVKFVDTSSYSYNWDGTRRPSIYGRGELGNGRTLHRQNKKNFASS